VELSILLSEQGAKTWELQPFPARAGLRLPTANAVLYQRPGMPFALCILVFWLTLFLGGVAPAEPCERSIISQAKLEHALAIESPVSQLLRNVPQRERHHLFPTSGELGLRPQVLRLFEQGNWNRSTLPLTSAQKMEPYLRVAVSLLLDNSITVDQLSTLLFLWEAVSDLPYDLTHSTHGIRVIGSDGKLTSAARQVFLDSPMPLARQYQTGGMHWNHSVPDPVVIQQLESAIRKLPKSERYFWQFRYPKSLLATSSHSPLNPLPDAPPAFAELFRGLFSQGLLNGWHRTDPDSLVPNSWLQIVVPSVGMLRVLQNLRFQKSALQPVPQLGYVGPDEVIDQLLSNRRVLGLHFPGVTGLTEADGYPSGKFGFTYHDIFHLVWGSRILPGPRSALSQFFHRIKPLASRRLELEIAGQRWTINARSAAKDKLDELKDSIIDAAFANYDQDNANWVGQVFQPQVELLNAGANQRVLYSANGYLYFLIDMAQHSSKYERWFEEPMEMLLPRIDASRAQPLPVSSLSIYEAVKQLPAVP
jgi:hypothetical protein